MVGEGECLRHSHASPTSESSPNLIHIWNEWVCGTGKQRQKEECVCVCVRFWRWMLRMGVNGNSDSKAARATVEIKELRFTYPGIDGHPPPGSTPLIQDFSLTLNSGDRCLLVGSNGAGSLSLSLSSHLHHFHLHPRIEALLIFYLFMFVVTRKDHHSQDIRREAHGGAWYGSCARKISFPWHHVNIFRWSLLPWWWG